jgi:tetratricopeptide (TPR) repeat protein
VNTNRGVLIFPARISGPDLATTFFAIVLSVAPEHASAHLCLGGVQMQTNRAAQGIAECERALALDRNLARAHALIGMAKFLVDCAEETETHIKDALRLSPRDKYAHSWMAIAGYANLLLSKDEEAVELCRRAIEVNRNYPNAHFWLAANLALLGRHADARAATEAGLTISPTFTITHARARTASDNPIYRSQRERFLDGLRKAAVASSVDGTIRPIALAVLRLIGKLHALRSTARVSTAGITASAPMRRMSSTSGSRLSNGRLRQNGAPDYDSGGQEFESLRACRLTQWLARTCPSVGKSG